jgi:hypothetical protein
MLSRKPSAFSAVSGDRGDVEMALCDEYLAGSR